MIHNRRYQLPRIAFVGLAAASGFFPFTGALASGADVNVSELQKAADRGAISKEIELAGDYFVGRGVPKDTKLAAYWYEKAAEGGDPEAENQIGYLYQTGDGVPADMSRAVHWYQLSSASGFPLAKVNLGVMYCWGTGVAQNDELAVQLFREAADKGSGVAATYLGNMYYFGRGVKQDNAAAESWYGVGVKRHEPMAEYNVASLLTVTRDHPQDFAKGADLLRKSAGSGFVPAMHSLGLLLIKHPELADSPQEAHKFLEAAANAGWWRSSIILGIRARDGFDDSPGPESAYYHFQIAMLQGGEQAKTLLAKDMKALASKLPDDKQSQLTADANTWFAQHKSTLGFVFNEREHSKRFPGSALTVPPADIHAGLLLPAPPS